MSLSRTQFRNVALLTARRLEEKKAEEMILLDLHRSPSAVADYLLVLSANSHPHLRALSEAAEETMEMAGLNPIHRDGKGSDHWLVLDYGGLLIHIFHQDFRSFYNLERLWEDAKTISLSDHKSVKKKRKKT
ncbi:MAG: ribosome silencing factor [Elusimicrobia bacterium]|nr:ribosome silencing factor [Elusimicrobiota bacterium]